MPSVAIDVKVRRRPIVWLADQLAPIAHRASRNGEMTKCAAGYYEFFNVVGPLAFLYNGDGDLVSYEIHLGRWCLFHVTYFDCRGMYGKILGVRFSEGIDDVRTTL